MFELESEVSGSRQGPGVFGSGSGWSLKSLLVRCVFDWISCESNAVESESGFWMTVYVQWLILSSLGCYWVTLRETTTFVASEDKKVMSQKSLLSRPSGCNGRKISRRPPCSFTSAHPATRLRKAKKVWHCGQWLLVLHIFTINH